MPPCGEVPALKGTDSAFLRCFRGQAGDGSDPGDESRLGVLADQEPEQAGFWPALTRLPGIFLDLFLPTQPGPAASQLAVACPAPSISPFTICSFGMGFLILLEPGVHPLRLWYPTSSLRPSPETVNTSWSLGRLEISLYIFYFSGS